MYFPAVRSCAFSKVTARRVPGAVRRAQRGAEDRQVAVRGAQRGGEDRQVADHVTESATTLALATQSATTLADATQSKTSSDTQSTAKTRPARRLGPTSSDHRAAGAMPPPSSRPRGEGGLRPEDLRAADPFATASSRGITKPRNPHHFDRIEGGRKMVGDSV